LGFGEGCCMSAHADDETEGGAVILTDGQAYLWDVGALLDEYQADAIKFIDGDLWVLKETSRQWVRVDPIKPTAAGRVRGLRGTTNGTD